MPVVSRIARIRIADTATGLVFREWVATAAVQDAVAGSSINVTVTQTTGGATPPGEADTLALNFYNDSGTLIRTVPLTPGSASQSVTFVLTSTGEPSGTSPRAGTVEIAIRATRTSIGTYDVESDGSPNTPGAGNVSATDRGWIRGTIDATTTLSNVALGGAKATPAQYDESLFARTTLGAPLYVARSLTVAISGATPTLSAGTTFTATGPWDATFTGVVDDRFPAAVTTVTTSLTVPNASLTGQPDTVLTTTNDSLNVDPRLTAVHHFQVDDNSFAVAKHDASKSMLSTSSGFLATRLVTARTASGVNNLTVNQDLTPVRPGDRVSNSSVTLTRDGQDGWTSLLSWPSSKPGGAWNKFVDIVDPSSDIDSNAHLIGATDAYTMLAPDPNIKPYCSLTVPVEADHAHPGDILDFVLTVETKKTRTRVAVDAASAFCSLVRFNVPLARWEFLDTDDATWVEWTLGTVRAQHPLTETPPGSRSYAHTFDTSGWSDTDVVSAAAHFKIDGTPYDDDVPRELVGRANAHSGGGIMTAQTTIAP